jgi:hypothetical protein
LHEYAKSLAKPTSGPDKPETASQNSVENFLHFLDVYGDRVEQLDSELEQHKKELEKNAEQLHVAQENLNRLIAGCFNDSM